MDETIVQMPKVNEIIGAHKRVLLLYITKVSGHRQATLAIQRALKEQDSTTIAPTVNGFGYTYPVLEKVVNRAYMSVIKSTPKVWDFLYDNPSLVKNSVSIKEFLHKTSHKKIEKLFKRHKPDVVVCTQAFPCGMMADFKRTHGLKTKIVGVLTDFAPHSFWLNDGVDYYVVPSEDSRERFAIKGIPLEKIKVLGIPVRTKFALQSDKVKIANELGLDPTIPTLLIMGGGQGLGPIKSIVKSLIKIKQNVQMIVLTGTNKKILKNLRKKAEESHKKILVYEFASNVDELMDLSTLIITKPGGITTAESLVKGLPMVIVNPIPGQEMRNTDFLINKGIAIRIDKSRDIGEEIELLLKSPERLLKMRKNALAHGKPFATQDVAKLILES